MSTRSAVLDRLRGGGEVSGESLATELGVSRVSVGKAVAALRSLGYEIDAVPGTGYRLISAPDAPLPTEVLPRLTDPLWVRLEGGGETGSTNDDARALARAGAPEGTVVLASRQTSGRGRLGRSWSSPAGGVYLSAVLRPSLAPVEMGPLALVVGLGIARGLDRLGVTVGLKWPNDVLMSGRKLAGILLEMTAEGDRVDWVVVGLGINVRRPDDAHDDAAYLTDTHPTLSIPQVTASVLDYVAGAYREWLGAGFSVLAEEYRKRSTLAGAHVAVRSIDGVVHAEGEVVGVDDAGRLLLAGPSGTTAVSTGEVTLRS